MSFQDDVVDADFRRDVAFHRPAMAIEVRGPGDELIQRIELPELALKREECSPEWLAMVGLEQEAER